MDDTEHLGGFANYSADWLASMTMVSVRTARRWRAKASAPALVVRWLHLLGYGSLGTLSAAWNGWHLRDGKLYHPDGRWHTPSTLSAEQLRMQENSSLWAEVRRLRADLAMALARLHDLTALTQPVALFNSPGGSAPLSHYREPLGYTNARTVPLASAKVPDVLLKSTTVTTLAAETKQVNV